MNSLRFAAALGLASLGGTSSLASDQATAEAAQQAADAAEQIAQEAEDAIRAIDPTTGGDSLIVDPSLPQPYGPTLGADDVDLPELPAAGEPPRGPAARMIDGPGAEMTPSVAPPLESPAPAVAPSVAQAPAPTPAPAPAPRQAAKDPFTVNSILSIPPGPFRYGDWYWDASAGPAKGKLVVTVDLDARVISVFRDGHEIGTAVALLGTKKHPTPLGTFPILTKEKDNISEKYDNAPMPWTLRLTWDGIAIHGSPVINGYASHGCIGVPDEFAEKLFAIARRGDKVYITRGKIIGMGDKLARK
ncbi:MAG: L,D-transpeptidase family protein [Pseudomonadota bacterium]